LNGLTEIKRVLGGLTTVLNVGKKTGEEVKRKPEGLKVSWGRGGGRGLAAESKGGGFGRRDTVYKTNEWGANGLTQEKWVGECPGVKGILGGRHP